MAYLKIKYVFKILILSLVMVVSFAAIALDNTQFNHRLKVFSKGSLVDIKRLHAGKPFVLIVWSVDCLPCRQEFDMLREVKKKHPELNLSIVATESVEDVPELSQILTEHQLLAEDNWAFAETNSAKLRYAIDPNWYGELPRAHFYDHQHSRTAVSGKLPKSKVVQWLDQFNHLIRKNSVIANLVSILTPISKASLVSKVPSISKAIPTCKPIQITG